MFIIIVISQISKIILPLYVDLYIPLKYVIYI